MIFQIEKIELCPIVIFSYVYFLLYGHAIVCWLYNGHPNDPGGQGHMTQFDQKLQQKKKIAKKKKIIIILTHSHLFYLYQFVCGSAFLFQ